MEEIPKAVEEETSSDIEEIQINPIHLRFVAILGSISGGIGGIASLMKGQLGESLQFGVLLAVLIYLNNKLKKKD